MEMKKEDKMSNETIKKDYPAKKEKEALNQIRKIVDGLGEVSHVRAAMDGALEMAEDNIKKGIYCSPRKTIEAMQQREEALKKTIQDMQEKRKESDELELNERVEFWKRMDRQKENIKERLDLIDAIAKETKKMSDQSNQCATDVRNMAENTFKAVDIYLLEVCQRIDKRKEKEKCMNS